MTNLDTHGLDLSRKFFRNEYLIVYMPGIEGRHSGEYADDHD